MEEDTKDITYWPHLNTKATPKVMEAYFNGRDVIKYKRGEKFDIFCMDSGSLVSVSNFDPDTPFDAPDNAFLKKSYSKLRSVVRSIARKYKKLDPNSCENVDLDKFEQELKEHGGIDSLHVGRVDYIECADGQTFVLDKTKRKVLRL